MIAPEELGRIAAQSAKQVIVQKLKEAERDIERQEATIADVRELRRLAGLVGWEGEAA